MTEEQFQKLLDKLDEIKRAQPVPQYIGYPAPQPWDPRYADQHPWHWQNPGARD